MKKFFLILITCCVALLSLSAQSSVTVAIDIQKNSTLAINGTTNVIAFKFYQTSDKFIRKNLIVTALRNQNKLFLSENRLAVPVKKFDSTNKMALKDFFKMMKSDAYPTLQIQLDHIEFASSNSLSKGNAIADVTITGITKRYSFPVDMEQKGDYYTFIITKNINIRDFGLTPPKQMMGMIKVNEWINIDLHMICYIQPFNQTDLVINSTK